MSDVIGVTAVPGEVTPIPAGDLNFTEYGSQIDAQLDALSAEFGAGPGSPIYLMSPYKGIWEGAGTVAEEANLSDEAAMESALGYSGTNVSTGPGGEPLTNGIEIANLVASTGGTENPDLLATAVTEGYQPTAGQLQDAIQQAESIEDTSTTGESDVEIANNQDAADYALGILDTVANGGGVPASATNTALPTVANNGAGAAISAATLAANTALSTVANNASTSTNPSESAPSSGSVETALGNLTSEITSGAGSVVTWLESNMDYVIAGGLALIGLYVLVNILGSGTGSSTGRRFRTPRVYHDATGTVVDWV
jgi:hypothetical protein